MAPRTLDQVAVWLLRASWASLPFLAGPTLADALHDTDGSFRTSVSIGLWAIWGVTLLATLIPHGVTLTVHRIVAPASLTAVVWAVFETEVSAGAVIALSATVVASMASLAPNTAAVFVDGSSYGDELRLPLRAPAPLLLGPIPLTWAVTVSGAAVGPLLLADRHWIVGTAAALIGLAAAALGTRALYALARRWVVFVPAGIVLHDLMTLADPQLFRRRDIDRLAPALGDSPARDFSARAAGLLLELQLRAETKVAVRSGGPRRRSRAEPEQLTAFLFAPTQPGRVLVAATERDVRTT